MSKKNWCIYICMFKKLVTILFKIDNSNFQALRNKSHQLAAVSLLAGSLPEAETVLLHNGLIYQAILTNIQMHNWNKSLDLALKHKTHIDTVLFLRHKYLQSINKEENNPKFLKLKDSVSIFPITIFFKFQINILSLESAYSVNHRHVFRSIIIMPVKHMYQRWRQW